MRSWSMINALLLAVESLGGGAPAAIFSNASERRFPEVDVEKGLAIRIAANDTANAKQSPPKADAFPSVLGTRKRIIAIWRAFTPVGRSKVSFASQRSAG